MVKSIYSNILVNSGHFLENLVYIHLRRFSQKIFYYKTNSAKEVDFVAILGNRKKIAIQVCETLLDEKTRKREITALKECLNELNLKLGYILTANTYEEIFEDQLRILVIPIWRFIYDSVEMDA